jgi:hypothetical protein
MKKNTSTPFRQLELQLQLEELDQKWEAAKKNYNKKDADVESVDEILKLTAERIKVLSEIYMTTYEA